jgi:hypothetical protein
MILMALLLLWSKGGWASRVVREGEAERMAVRRVRWRAWSIKMAMRTTTELHPVCSETQFDRMLAEAQQLEEPVIFV